MTRPNDYLMMIDGEMTAAESGQWLTCQPACDLSQYGVAQQRKILIWCVPKEIRVSKD